MELKRKWKLLVIHHSHTDIGYTNRQEKIEQHHIGNIKQAVDILNEAHLNAKTQWLNFKWTCESFWSVEKFLETSSDEYIRDFVGYVKKGNISISGNYLNCTELLNSQTFDETLKRCSAICKDFDMKFTCGMTADINGYGWGYSDILINNGIVNLLSCIHPHHGYHPTYKKQRPFYWQTPSKQKLLVWLGDNYHIGNELGIAQYGGWEYMIKDGLSSSGLSPFEISQKRIFTYLLNLEKDNYPFDFVPITVSGLMTDNAPPSVRVIEFVNKWNVKFGNEISISMATLEEFFAKVSKHEKEIETFAGDWPDWWADGVCSTPNVVKHYRDAQRKYSICKKLDPEAIIGNKKLMDDALSNLMLYSEHTWGFSSSVSEPWHTLVNDMDLRKNLYAEKAHESVCRNLDLICYAKGETPISLHHDLCFKIINANKIKIEDVAKFCLEILFEHKYFEIIDDKTARAVPFQLARIPRGFEVSILAKLDPLEEKTFSIKEIPDDRLITSEMNPRGGSDGVIDLNKSYNDLSLKNIATPYYLESHFFRIEFNTESGITSLYDKKNSRELIRQEREFNLFTPVYEVTPIETDACTQRKVMGRNRKAISTKRYQGRLKDAVVTDNGDVFSRVILKYELPGTTLCNLVLTIYRDISKIDLTLHLHKNSVWEPENFYLSLPLTTGNSDEVFVIDKIASLVRPRIDQIPGSCTDFYLMQNGMAYISKDSSLILATPDAPMISMGTIHAHPIKLSGEFEAKNIDHVYSWIMNNFWETNFKATLGGFQEYSYSLFITEETEPDKVFNIAEAINCGTVSFTQFDRLKQND